MEELVRPGIPDQAYPDLGLSSKESSCIQQGEGNSSPVPHLA